MAIRRKRKPKKAAPVCAPAKAPASRATAASAKRKPVARKPSTAPRRTAASAGSGPDATAAAARRRALAKAAPRTCATPARKKATKKRPAAKAQATGAMRPLEPAPVAVAAAPLAAAGPVGSPVPPATRPKGAQVSAPEVQDGFGRREAERLLWRAGFGPRPGDVDRLVQMGLDAAVESFVAPAGAEQLVGPEPTAGGKPLAAGQTWGHDHLLLLDRMVRSSDQLRWKMVLVWHDWFATSKLKVAQAHVLEQMGVLWIHGRGRFDDLLRDVTQNAGMLDWLDGIRNHRWSPNENYARELMELFTLGANRGAYTEADVREAARALTGWRASWTDGRGLHDFRFDPNFHDKGTKTIFGQTGAFGWQDVVRLVLEHPQHASWFVTRLWWAFAGAPVTPEVRAQLEHVYVSSGRQIAPVLRAILKHPDFYAGPTMMKPPVVQAAGLLRALGRGIDTADWAWLGEMSGQLLCQPPDVAGWDESRWMASSTWAGRWYTASWALAPSAAKPWDTAHPYDATETPGTAVERAIAHLGDPLLPPETHEALLRFARTALPPVLASWQEGPYRAMRQNALRMLIATSADYQTA